MNTGNIQISPVDLKERKELGIKAGDTVRVWQKIEEKGKTRLQAFEGIVLAVKHGTEPGATFTVRKVSLGVGVEKIFPLYSPVIDKIEILKRARVRKAKLYFVRDKVSRELRRIFRKTVEMGIATKGAAELEEERKRAEEELKKQEEEAKKAEEEAKAAEAATAEAADGADESADDTADNATETKEESTEEKTDDNAEESKEEAAEEAADATETDAKEAQEADDLTKIEGIGPKIAEVLAQNGITTFAQLADAKDEDTQEMIKDVPGNHRADTWNEQAALARDGKWDELKELQDKLDGGVAKDEEAQEAIEEVDK